MTAPTEPVLTLDIDRLRELTETWDSVMAEAALLRPKIRSLALALVADGVPKIQVARAAGVSRPTLDAWLKKER